MMDLLFKDCLSNQTYRSKTIQNEIIEICGAYISDAIVSEIKRLSIFRFWPLTALMWNN